MRDCNLVTPCLSTGRAAVVRQLGDIDGDAPRLIACQQLRGSTSPRFLLEIDMRRSMKPGNLKPTSRNISVHCSTSKRPSSTSRRLEKTAKTSSGIASTIAAG